MHEKLFTEYFISIKTTKLFTKYFISIKTKLNQTVKHALTLYILNKHISFTDNREHTWSTMILKGQTEKYK